MAVTQPQLAYTTPAAHGGYFYYGPIFLVLGVPFTFLSPTLSKAAFIFFSVLAYFAVWFSLHRLFPEVKPAPVAALPPQFKDAVLYVRAGIRHPGQGYTPWNKGVDEAALAAGFDYKVDGTAVWKDAQGTAWFGEKKLRVDLTVPAPALYDLYVHFHDWNDNKRTGKVVVEGREFELGPHAGEGRWVRFDILREDALDNRLVLEATPSSGPNLQITAVALVPEK